MLAAQDAEAKKVAEITAAHEEQFVDRVAFLARNVRGEYSLCFSCAADPISHVLAFVYGLYFCVFKSSWRFRTY